MFNSYTTIKNLPVGDQRNMPEEYITVINDLENIIAQYTSGTYILLKGNFDHTAICESINRFFT